VLVAEILKLSLCVWPEDRFTDGFCIENVNPRGDAVTSKDTVPEKPDRLVTTICDWLFWPTGTVRRSGLAARLKSVLGTVTVTLNEWTIRSLVPVTPMT
jgi:hypothetical protein